MTTATRLEGFVPEELSGLRVDRALAQIFPEHSRTRLQGWIRSGAATLDGATVRAKDRIAGGEWINIHCDVKIDDQWVAQPGPISILYDDPDLLILDKPPGVIVHPGAGHHDATLLNRLLAYDPGLRTIPRAGLVHRLDKDTSGLMLVARSLPAHTRLVAQIKARAVERVYEAIVIGAPPSPGMVQAAIGRHRIHRTRMAVNPRGKPAVTHYRAVERYAQHTRLEVTLETGRTHQIRVHLAHLGYPIVGDATYGGRRSRAHPAAAEALLVAISNFPRQALHARRLSLDHPISDRPLTIESAPAPDIQGLIETLRASPPDPR